MNKNKLILMMLLFVLNTNGFGNEAKTPEKNVNVIYTINSNLLSVKKDDNKVALNDSAIDFIREKNPDVKITTINTLKRDQNGKAILGKDKNPISQKEYKFENISSEFIKKYLVPVSIKAESPVLQNVIITEKSNVTKTEILDAKDVVKEFAKPLPPSEDNQLERDDLEEVLTKSISEKTEILDAKDVVKEFAKPLPPLESKIIENACNVTDSKTPLDIQIANVFDSIQSLNNKDKSENLGLDSNLAANMNTIVSTLKKVLEDKKLDQDEDNKKDLKEIAEIAEKFEKNEIKKKKKAENSIGKFAAISKGLELKACHPEDLALAASSEGEMKSKDQLTEKEVQMSATEAYYANKNVLASAVYIESSANPGNGSEVRKPMKQKLKEIEAVRSGTIRRPAVNNAE